VNTAASKLELQAKIPQNICWLCNRKVQYDVGFAAGIYSMTMALQLEYTVCWFWKRNIQYVDFATFKWKSDYSIAHGNAHHKKEDKIAPLMHENGRVGDRPKTTENNSS